MSDSRYSDNIGRTLNAYLDAAIARATSDPNYDAKVHAAAAEKLDAMLEKLDRDSDRMDYLCDWVSSVELIIASGGDPTCKRADTEGKRDRLWINPDDNGPRYFGNETLREALDDAMRKNAASAVPNAPAPTPRPAHEEG